MSSQTLTAQWRDEPVRPGESDDVNSLVGLARSARGRAVEFDWVLTREELHRLREAVHFWGGPIRGRYSEFDAQMDALAEGHQRTLWRPTLEYGKSLTDFLARADTLIPKLRELFAALRCYLIVLDNDKRFRDALEGTLGRHFQSHEEASIRGSYWPGTRLPAPVGGDPRTTCRFPNAPPIAGMPTELVV
jgi:hypothetical protein